MDFRWLAVSLCLSANVLLWTAAASSQVDPVIGAIENITRFDPALGFAGLVIAFVLVFVTMDGRSHRIERREWTTAIRTVAESNVALAAREAQLIETIKSLQAAIERHS